MVKAGSTTPVNSGDEDRTPREHSSAVTSPGVSGKSGLAQHHRRAAGNMLKAHRATVMPTINSIYREE